MAVSETIRCACQCGARLALLRLSQWYTCAECGRRWRATVGLATAPSDGPGAAQLRVTVDLTEP